jgi:hypothetical protein
VSFHDVAGMMYFLNVVDFHRLPKLPFIVKARYVSAKAEYVENNFSFVQDVLNFYRRAKIKEAGGVVSLIA